MVKTKISISKEILEHILTLIPGDCGIHKHLHLGAIQGEGNIQWGLRQLTSSPNKA